MKLLLLTILLIFSVGTISAQETVSDKNIQTCFKHSSKTPASFDQCVADEFRRVKEAKEYREARIRVGKDPNAGCGKSIGSNECFDEIMSDLRASTERLHELGDTTPYYPVRTHRYDYRTYRYLYFPRPYLRTYYPFYPSVYVPRFYVPRLR